VQIRWSEHQSRTRSLAGLRWVRLGGRIVCVRAWASERIFFLWYVGGYVIEHLLLCMNECACCTGMYGKGGYVCIIIRFIDTHTFSLSHTHTHICTDTHT